MERRRLRYRMLGLAALVPSVALAADPKSDAPVFVPVPSKPVVSVTTSPLPGTEVPPPPTQPVTEECKPYFGYFPTQWRTFPGCIGNNQSPPIAAAFQPVAPLPIPAPVTIPEPPPMAPPPVEAPKPRPVPQLKGPEFKPDADRRVVDTRVRPVEGPAVRPPGPRPGPVTVTTLTPAGTVDFLPPRTTPAPSTVTTKTTTFAIDKVDAPIVPVAAPRGVILGPQPRVVTFAALGKPKDGPELPPLPTAPAPAVLPNSVGDDTIRPELPVIPASSDKR